MICPSCKTGFVPQFNPKGIVSFSPGLRGTSYPGKVPYAAINPNGVAARASRFCHNPVGVEDILKLVTQGSSFLATLGFVPESRWDSEADPQSTEART